MKTTPRQLQNNFPENSAGPLGFDSALALLSFGALCCLMLAAPYYFSGLPAAAVDLEAGAAYVPPMLLLSLTALACLLLGISGARAPRSALSLCLLAFLAWCALSFAVSVYRHDSLLEFARLSACVAWFFIARTLLFCENKTMRNARLNALLFCIVAGIALVGASAILNFLKTRDPRQFGTFFNPNLFANYCAMSLPLALSLLVLTRRTKNVGLLFVAGVLLLFIGGGLVVTSSKGGFLSALAALCVFAASAFFARGKAIGALLRAQRNVAIAGTLLVVILGGALFQKTVLPRLQAAGGGEDNSTMFRVYTWKGTLAMAQERPVLGWGTGAFQSAYPQFAQTGFTRTAHQVWLQLASESGFPAALLLLTVCALGAKRAWTALSGADWPLAAGGLATLTAFVIHGLTDAGWSLVSIALLLTLTLALLDSLLDSRGEAAPISDDETRSFNYAWLLVALIFGAFSAGYGRVVQGEDAAAAAREALAKSMPETALEKAREATDADPLSARLWRTRARIEIALRQDAQASLQTALRLQPTRAAHYILLAEDTRQQNPQAPVEELYDKAVTVDPNDTGTRLARAEYLLTLKTAVATEKAWKDYEHVAALYDAPYGKYPAIAEMVNLDFVRAFLKMAEHARSQKSAAAAQGWVDNSRAVIARWRANEARNRSIAQDSQTESTFEREAGEVAELEAQINNLASGLKMSSKEKQ